MRKLLLGKYIGCLALVCVLFFASCKREQPTIVRINQQEFSPEEQQEIGEYLLNISRQSNDLFMVLDRNKYSEVYDYINTLVVMLAYTEWVEHSRSFDWEVTILKDDDFQSAFMLPGGRLFIYTGMLKLLKDESELAALIAHELMYSDKGLVIEALKEEFGGAILADILLDNEIPQEKGEALINWTREMSFPKMTVEEADIYAVRAVCPFQYDATSMINLLRRIEEQNNQSTEVKWSLTRPGKISSRIDNLLIAIGACETRNGSGFEARYQEMIALLP